MTNLWAWFTKNRPRKSPKVDADAAHARAKEDLGRTVEQWPEVERLARELRLRRRENHFAEQIRKSMGIPE